MADDKRTVAPCGCVFETINDTFVLTACPRGKACEVVQYALNEVQRQSKPFSLLED